jgi:hypothetical protein
MRSLIMCNSLIAVGTVAILAVVACKGNAEHDIKVKTPETHGESQPTANTADEDDRLTVEDGLHALTAMIRNGSDPRLEGALPVLQSPPASQPGWGIDFASVGWQVQPQTRTWTLIFWTSERGIALECWGTFTKAKNAQWEAQLTKIRRFSRGP